MTKLTVDRVKEILSKVEYVIGKVEVTENEDSVFTITKNYVYRMSGMQYILEKHIVDSLYHAGFGGSDYEVTEVSDNWFKNQQSYVKVELQSK